MFQGRKIILGAGNVIANKIHQKIQVFRIQSLKLKLNLSNTGVSWLNAQLFIALVAPSLKARGYVNWHRLINAVKTKRGYLFVTASFLVI